MLPHDGPDNIKPHFAITVDEAVAHAGDVAPGNAGEGALCGGGDLAGRLADDLQRSNDRILMETTREEGCLVEAFDKVSHVTRCERHIEEQRRIARG